MADQCEFAFSNIDRRVGNFSDDSPLSQLVRQINKETDSDKRLAASKKLEEFVNQPSNFQVRYCPAVLLSIAGLHMLTELNKSDFESVYTIPAEFVNSMKSLMLKLRVAFTYAGFKKCETIVLAIGGWRVHL